MSSFDMSFRKERHHYYAEYLKLQDDPISLKQQHYRKHPRFSYPHNNQLGIRPEKAILPGKTLIKDLHKRLKVYPVKWSEPTSDDIYIHQEFRHIEDGRHSLFNRVNLQRTGSTGSPEVF